MDIKRRTNRALLTIFALALVLASTPTKINAEIPAIRGVYELFAPDVIGIGQALMTKGWIGNVLTYAPKENEARIVIELLFNKLRDSNGQIIEAGELLLSGADPAKSIFIDDFCKILKHIHDYKKDSNSEKRRQELKSSLSNPVKKSGKRINDLLEGLEKLKDSNNFISGTAEAILWAFFERKFTTGLDFEAAKDKLDYCLSKLKMIVGETIYTAEEYKNFEDELRGYSTEKQIAEVINNYDLCTNLSIKKARSAGSILPPEVSQISKQYNYKGTMIPEDPFPICFEATILDTISILLNDPKTGKYNPEMLPTQATKSPLFKTVIKDVFKNEAGSFIDSSSIDQKTQAWIQIIEDKKGIKYNKKENISGQEVNLDLNTTIENLIKILNELYSLEFVIDQDINKLKINIKNVISKPADAKDFWNKLFVYISKKLETEKRKVTFTCELTNSPQPVITDDTVEIADSTGKINVKIEYTDPDYFQFGSDFEIEIMSGHAKLNCNKRKSLGITMFREDFPIEIARKAYETKNPKLFPLLILLAETEMAEKTDLKMQNLLFYCLNLKDINGKLEILKVAAQKGLFDDQSFQPTIKQFIENILTNEGLTSELLDYILLHNIKNKITDAIIKLAIEKEPGKLLLKIVKSEPKKWLEEIALKMLTNEKIAYQIFTNDLLTNELLDSVLKCDTKNKILDAIIELAIEKRPGELLLKIVKSEPKKWLEEIALKMLTNEKIAYQIFTNDLLTSELLDYILFHNIKNKITDAIIRHAIKINPTISLPKAIDKVTINEDLKELIEQKIKSLDNVSFNTPWDCTILSLAQKKGLKKIVEAILKNPRTENFDKLIYYINEIEKLTKEEEKKEAYVKVIELIKDPKTEINGPGKMFTTPLHLAIEKNNIELFKTLLTHKKIDINKQEGYEHRTPLTYVLLRNYFQPDEKTIQFVEALLNHKNENGEYDINLSIKDRNNRIAIDYAEGEIKNLIKTREAEKTRLKTISEVKSSTKDTAINLLHKILKMDQTKTDAELQASAIEIIKDPEIEISKIIEGVTALTNSAYKKMDTISKAILNNPKVKAFDKLNYYIITGDNINAIKLIDDPETEINGPKGLFSKSLQHAVNNKNKKLVEKLLLRTDVEVQSCLSTAIHRSTEILELLLKDNRTKINARIDGDRTALDIAEMYENKEKIELLKKYAAKNGVGVFGERILIDGEEN